MPVQDPFFEMLEAPGRAAEIPESADVYGWLVGSWALEVLHYKAKDLKGRGLTAEAHFSWVLEGRAVQDVWIMPRQAERSANDDLSMNMYGTTLRSWDPAIEAWRIAWTNPAHNHREHQIGRRVGGEIVQIGTRPDGTVTRWRFTDITPDSFHWIGEALGPDGARWQLEGEFLARRMR